MYVSHVSLKNIRCFKNVCLDFQNPAGEGEPNNVTLILGDNSAGKTTLLKAIALAVLTPVIHNTGYRAYHMIREGMNLGKIGGSLLLQPGDGASSTYNWPTELDFQRVGDSETLDLPLENNRFTNGISPEHQRLKDNYYQDNHAAFFTVGYGATRRMETGDYTPGSKKSKWMPRYHWVASLFEDDVALLPLAAWLPKLNSSRRGEVLQLINQLFPQGETRLLDKPRNGEFVVESQGLPVPFSALSDGYRAFLAWTTDLLGHLSACTPDPIAITNMPGVVLVDEVDLHLHPAWQLLVIEKISTLFPRLQFILTSHSPIVAGTLPASHIYHVVRDAEGNTVTQGSEEIMGRSAEQILLSPYFGMRSTRAAGVRRQLQELSRLANEGDLDAARQYLALAGRGES